MKPTEWPRPDREIAAASKLDLADPSIIGAIRIDFVVDPREAMRLPTCENRQGYAAVRLGSGPVELQGSPFPTGN